MTKAGTRAIISGDISGGISGATIDPNSPKGEEKAVRLYDRIRDSDEDVLSITRTLAIVHKDLGVSVGDIQKIKEYLFYDSHQMSDGFHPFIPEPDIPDSWLRLTAGASQIKPHDITLIRYEILEMRYVDSGMTQAEAHELASPKYDYDEECRKYHGKVGKHKERR